MATTKMKPITKTLKKAIDYIIDPEKTLDGSLVSSYGCSVGTADIEMAMTAQQGSMNGNRIAYHLIQSFPPGENITPQQAHEIGLEYARRFLGNQYEFVISTHVDKGHIHNHIIFNATNYMNHKKYHASNWELERMRRESDKICRENNLSVLEKTSGKKGKPIYEYKRSKEEITWKSRLKDAIDEIIPEANNFNEFCFLMEKAGYEIKKGKRLSFRSIGQDRFTRSETVGDFYTEKMICERIENKEKYKNIPVPVMQKKRKSTDTILHAPQKINLITDISKCLKAQESGAYKRAVVRNNMDNLVKTMNFLLKHNLKTVEQLETKINDTAKTYYDINNSIKTLDDDMAVLSEKIKFTQNYFKYGKVARQAKREALGSNFLKEHDNEILLYHAAEIYMERSGTDTRSLNLKEMFDKYKQLKTKREFFCNERKPLQSQLKEFRIIQANVEATLQIKLNTDSTSLKAQKRKHDMER